MDPIVPPLSVLTHTHPPPPTPQHPSHSGADHAAVGRSADYAALPPDRPFGPLSENGGRPILGA